MQTAKSLFFIAPRKVEVRETPLPPLNADEVLVETICSAVSAGTEMLVYRGQFPQSTDAHDRVSSEVKYPLAYGYACVGKIRDIGKLADRELAGRLVFAFHPHASSFIAHPSSLIPIPLPLSPENACFLPNMETAVNLVQDGAPILGERVLVLGQGVVGLLTASLLSEFPLEKLFTVDTFDLRRKASGRINNVASLNIPEAQGISFAYTQDKFDLTFELTGSPSALNDAIEHTAFSGRIVIGSWYGQKRAEIDLGSAFHRSRIKLIASQVSTISPELSGRWDKSRRFDAAWKALERIQPEKWITHRFSIEEAEKAYQLLDENPQETIQVVFTYP
ncbi:MAG TPA: zinc-binding alcohol dehydrogenase [Anaerolineales bacterium]|nr:zinc-binding alcohol dehydrogenase [Anaerolineales bacterium]